MAQKVIVNTLGWLINNKACIEQYYEALLDGVTTGETNSALYKCPDAMFDIKNKFMMDTQFEKYRREQLQNISSNSTSNETSTKKKRKRKLAENDGEKAAMDFHAKVSSILEKALSQLLSLGLQHGVLQQKPQPFVDCDNNTNARQFSASKGPGENLVHLSNKAQETGVTSTQDVIITEASTGSDCYFFNTMVHCESERPVAIEVCGSHYIIPPRCSFLMSDISTLQPLLKDEKKYNIIVLDPPWQNKSIKRKKMYHTVSDEVLLTLPLREMLADQCVFVVWVTNKQRQHRFVTEELFPKLGLQYKAQWFWLKVTRYGEPVLPLDRHQKKPYECLLLGTLGDIKIPEDQVIVSVPSALHSRKPPLEELLVPVVKDSLKSEVNCLELFARNLTPGWTSWGNEVLKHQHSDYFTVQHPHE